MTCYNPETMQPGILTNRVTRIHKLYERIIFLRLGLWAEKLGLTQTQLGFRKGKKTTDHLAVTEKSGPGGIFTHYRGVLLVIWVFRFPQR
jgi:hypothetical protein